MKSIPQLISIARAQPTAGEPRATILRRRSFPCHIGFFTAAAALVASSQFGFAADALKTTSQRHQPSIANTASGSLDDYVFTAPAGWATTPYPDGIVLTSNNGEKCSLTLWAMRPAGSSLANDASRIFSEVFKTFQLKRGSTAPSMLRGVSAQGWDYYIIRHGISRPGDDYVFWGFVFVARLSNQVASISGISKDPLVSSCFGLMMSDVWPKFFYCLQFKNWTSSQSESALLKKVPGVWTTATATAGDRWEFAPKGRFASAAAAQRYTRTSSTEVLRITDAYFGDGAYSIQGHRITLTHDDKKDGPETGLIRCEQESSDGGHTWTEKLSLLRTSAIDGSEYEVTYTKQ